MPISKEQPARIDRLRPVALTDHFIKVAEKFMTKWVVEDIGPNLDVKQFGSRSGRSTNHCLVDIVNFLAKNADKLNTRTTVVTTDFTSAFDRVDHTVVVSKLVLSGCRPAIIPWIVDFLCNRTQSVRYLGEMSQWAPVTAGVPQGTRLAPILFLVLFNDALLSSNLERWKYVDDMTIAEARKRGSISEMQNNLDDLQSWCETNNMKLNARKCHVMVVDFGKTHEPLVDLSLGNQTLDKVQSVKILGVLLQENLKWDVHVNGMVTRANKRIYMLRTLKPFRLPIEDLILVYTGYIRPNVEYAVPVWHSGLTKKQTAQIERIQKRALRIILGTQYFSYHHALQITKLQSLHERRRELCLRFAKSLQCSAEFRDWLPPPRISRYTNSLRNVQTHRAIKCRTERYKDSPIPYLVDLMNNV